jgi:hypothetical protein
MALQVKQDVVRLLDRLSANVRVAVVTMTGSVCPVTLAHIKAFIESRKLLLSPNPGQQHKDGFSDVIGFLSLNPDSRVRAKMSEKGEKHISLQDRAQLVKLATADHPWLAYNPSFEFEAVRSLTKRWPKITFVHYHLNGADDVVKYQKWLGCGPNYRFITIGRPGETDKVLQGVAKAGIDLSRGYFIMGPELPDISSTAVRQALRERDVAWLRKLLHEDVMKWCVSNGPYQPPEPKTQTHVASKQSKWTAFARRRDANSKTMLRKVPTDQRDDAAWAPSRRSVYRMRTGDGIKRCSKTKNIAQVKGECEKKSVPNFHCLRTCAMSRPNTKFRTQAGQKRVLKNHLKSNYSGSTRARSFRNQTCQKGCSIKI